MGRHWDLGEPLAGESAAMPRPEPWKYPGRQRGGGVGTIRDNGEQNLGDYGNT